MSFLKNRFEVKCPNCQNLLDKKPKRKKKCPHCQKYIYIRNGEMKTETEKELIDYAERLSFLDISVSDLEKENRKLSKRFGFKASVNDTIWSILNQSIRPMKHGRNSSIYAEMTRIAEIEGKESIQYKRESIRHSVYSLQETLGDFPFQIITRNVNDEDVCDNCRKLSKKEFSVDEFLEKMPIPNECQSEHGCRCWIHFKLLDL